MADDLTGAMDSSGYFAELGLKTVVALEPMYSLDADVLALNTESRALEPEEARRKVTRALHSARGRLIYKKMDSTLRGNIGVELEVILETRGYEKAVVAPAFPSMGRTTVNGMLLVNGVAVSETPFADDPIHPVREAHIPSLIQRSIPYRVGSVTVADIEGGPESLRRRIEEKAERIVVCDVTEQSHLKAIVRAAGLAPDRWLLCGSSGLAREMGVLVGSIPTLKVTIRTEGPTGSALVVIGTRNPVSAAQLERAEVERGLSVLNLTADHVKPEDGFVQMKENVKSVAQGYLKKQGSLALSSISLPYNPELKQVLPVFLAEMVKHLLERKRYSGLFLSGGDISVEVCRRLGVSAISVYGEVELGIPAGRIIGGLYPGLRLVTKAGGFGTEAAILNSMTYIEKGEIA